MQSSMYLLARLLGILRRRQAHSFHRVHGIRDLMSDFYARKGIGAVYRVRDLMRYACTVMRHIFTQYLYTRMRGRQRLQVGEGVSLK